MSPLDCTIEQAKAYNDQQQAIYEQTYMTAKEVEQIFKVSLSRQSQLVKEGRVVGVVHTSQRCLYIRNVASEWFEAYAQSQQSRINSREVKKSKGRPKKDLEAWRTFTLRGTEQRIPAKFSSRALFYSDFCITGLNWLKENNLPTMPGNVDFDNFMLYRNELRDVLGLNNSL